MVSLTEVFIISGLLAAALLAAAVVLSRGRRGKAAKNPSVFKTGNPPLTGGMRPHSVREPGDSSGTKAAQTP